MTFSKGKSLFFIALTLSTLSMPVKAQSGFTAPLSDADKSERIAKEMELYYLKPEMRNPYDRVQLQNGIATFTVWRDLPADPQADRTECAGYEWLLTGRGMKLGKGARSVFEKFPDVNAIQLQFIELEFKTKSVDGKGKLQKESTAKVYLRMTVERGKALGLKMTESQLQELLTKDAATCLKTGREIVSNREVYL